MVAIIAAVVAIDGGVDRRREEGGGRMEEAVLLPVVMWRYGGYLGSLLSPSLFKLTQTRMMVVWVDEESGRVMEMMS